VDFIELVPSPQPGEPDVVAPFRRTLMRYRGPVPTAAQRSQILAYNNLLANRTELRFQAGLLRAEAHVGLREFDDALSEYGLLLDDPAELSPRQLRFLAIRAGMAYLASGDMQFSSRNLSDDARALARSAYKNAISVVQEHDVSPNNPLYAQIVDYARNRLDMLLAGINFLGLRDSFVPVFRHESLLARTTAHIEKAQRAVEKFEDYQSKADNLEAAEQETRFELDIAREGVTIAMDRQTIAANQVERAMTQLKAISSQQGPFSFGNLATVFGQAAQIASGFVDKPDPVFSSLTAGGGAASMVVGFFARQKELDFQRQLAELDKEIADLEKKITDSEVTIAESRVGFLEDRLDFGPGRFDKDLYYALALFYEQLAERQVEAAIRSAYLYERALAFFLGKPGIAHIQFDYRNRAGELFELDADGKLITAADRLGDDVLKVTDEETNIEDVRRGFREPPFSLAREFPLEFSRFVQTPPGQTARMDFVISDYQLSKRRPDAHQVRIIRVVVQIVGIDASANFAGTLTHFGRFLVRDMDSTLDPRTVRLIPTPQEVENALREQREGGTPQAAIGGVIPYALEAQPILFGVPSDVTSQFAEFTLGAFEGYGPAGVWQLELRNVNVRNIADVTLTFDLEGMADVSALENRITPLIAAYEQELADEFVDGETLDRMKVFSLRRQFRDTFEALETGTGTLELRAEHFDNSDFDGEDARVRTVVAQALDPDGVGVAGVQLRISKPGTNFLLSRSTGADGFSEDFSQGRPPIQPPENRPAGVGSWRVRLPQRTQFNALDDLVLFFICDFR
jgi:hypothetical protein